MFNECLYISDIDTAKLNVQFFRPLAQCAVLFKCWFIWIRPWVVAFESLKTLERSSWEILKVVAVAYESSSLQTGFHIGVRN